ncbi:hypothetical protein TSUD_143000 [Trifolium subterraneum]|uniref:Uncharacterized protein n=1 Tax=Trifolium subterraneum TaxID=3900 RepID=A0A2Z6NLW2_TRISU|nr:hypothetical protein TSUD_143000 [Trifolium subterraneum]
MIVDDFGKSQHETYLEESLNVNSLTEGNQTQLLTPPPVIVNASEITTEIDESQIQDDMLNCVSSISFKPRPLSNSSPNSFHLSLSQESLGFSMGTMPLFYYFGNSDIPIALPSLEPPDRVVLPTSPLSAPYYPYDPGPINAPSLTNVCYTHNSFQYEHEGLTRTPFLYDKAIDS